jgi:hypothetical protein
MRSLLLIALLVALPAIGCSSTEAPKPFTAQGGSTAADADGDDDDDATTTEPKPRSGGYQPSKTPTDTSGVTPTIPAAQGITAWRGRVDTTPMVDFGGGKWCNYHVVLSDIELNMTVDGNGHITSSDLGNTMTETATACDAQPLGVQKNTYSFRPADANATMTSTVLQVPDPKNLPQAEVTLTIEQAGAGHLKARLLFHRTGAVDPVLN